MSFPSNTSNTSNSTAVFFLNYKADKTSAEAIRIVRVGDDDYKITCHHKSDLHEKKQTSTLRGNSQYVLDYLQNLVEILNDDIDVDPCLSVDVMVPGYPIFCLKAKKLHQCLLFSTLGHWMSSK